MNVSNQSNFESLSYRSVVWPMSGCSFIHALPRKEDALRASHKSGIKGYINKLMDIGKFTLAQSKYRGSVAWC